MIQCTHRPPCPGCPRLEERGPAPQAMALIKRLADHYGAQVLPAVCGAESGYRVRARLAVRGRSASPKLGIFQEASHRIADIPRCPIHHPSINVAAAGIRDAIQRCSLSPYAERPHVGALRGVQLVVERASKRVQVTLIENASRPQATVEMFPLLDELLAESLHSLWWNGNPERSNVILGPHWQHISGPACVEEQIGGARVFFPPAAFGQSNLDAADALVAYVHGLAAEAQSIAEFYAGSGAISLGLLATGKRVAANELNAAAVEALKSGAAVQGAQALERLQVHCSRAADAVAMAEDVDVVIVDPPRKGLDAGLLNYLAARPPQRLIYVSCGLSSLERDLGQLHEGGKLQVESLRGFDLFPHTQHLETVAVLSRR